MRTFMYASGRHVCGGCEAQKLSRERHEHSEWTTRQPIHGGIDRGGAGSLARRRRPKGALRSVQITPLRDGATVDRRRGPWSPGWGSSLRRARHRRHRGLVILDTVCFHRSQLSICHGHWPRPIMARRPGGYRTLVPLHVAVS